MAVRILMAGQNNVGLREFTVFADRPMKDIGVQQTVFDSLTLRDNIALSMADILTYNSSIFVKNYGRATLSTVAFRGTSPSHTQVTWNGMKINNPMLGMTDFSTIPSFFVDNASLLHGTSSVNEAGGGLGGLVRLSTSPKNANDGLYLQYVQGIGSFSTFDEFLKIGYGHNQWSFTTRAACSTSPNDYKYINHDKKLNIYDEEHNIVGQYHPVERNRSGAYKDIHLLQEVYYDTFNGDRFGLCAWYINSNRELPMLTTDYGDEHDFENRQREQTLRAVANWNHSSTDYKTLIRAGYIHSKMAYDYRREVTDGYWTDMTRSRSRVNTFYGYGEGDVSLGEKWYITGNIGGYQHFVKSEDKNVIMVDGNRTIVGYDKARIEMSAAVSAKWQPKKDVGLSLLLRQEMSGDRWAPLIPALFVDGIVCRKFNLMFKGSISRNYKFPSLNDLYFLPGGNPDLRNESGWTYDAGISFMRDWNAYLPIMISTETTWFDSRISDWIIWLPTTKGFFSPRNIKKVHSYGVEFKSNITTILNKNWKLEMSGTYSWTPSINKGDKMSPADQSVGKQLPYVPEHSATITGRLSWMSWSLSYKWAYYSKRYTMSSNDTSLSGYLPCYYMSNISFEKSLNSRPVDLQLKLAINNLFNEDYLSVLSRPMPGINFEFFISITPKFRIR